MNNQPIQSDALPDGRPTWLVAGSAPSAPRWIDLGLALADYTITTNSGWHMFLTAEPPRRPHYYWLHDTVAINLHARAARWMQNRGTVILTGEQYPEGMGIGLRDNKAALRRISLQPRPTNPRFRAWKPGEYINGRTSGVICLQYAVDQIVKTDCGGGRVLLVGMDGYKSTPGKVGRDTFDGRMGKAAGKKIVDEWQAPFLRAIVTACPSIEFIWLGIPNYAVNAPNARIVTDPSELYKEPDVKIQFVTDVNGHNAGEQAEYPKRAAGLLVDAGVAMSVDENDSPQQEETEEDGQHEHEIQLEGPHTQSDQATD